MDPDPHCVFMYLHLTTMMVTKFCGSLHLCITVASAVAELPKNTALFFFFKYFLNIPYYINGTLKKKKADAIDLSKGSTSYSCSHGLCLINFNVP